MAVLKLLVLSLAVLRRIAPMEAQNGTEIAELKQDIAALTKRLSHLEDTVKKTTKSAADTTARGMWAISRRLDSVANGLENSADLKFYNLRKHVNKNDEVLHGLIMGLREFTKRKVAFNAMVQRGRAAKVANGQIIGLHEVTINVGRGFNADAGIFTVPIRGLYFFTATSSPKQNGHKVSMALMVEGRPVAYSDAYRGDEEYQYQSATLHSVLSLYKGQRVFLMSVGDSYIRDDRRTIFSGFLVQPL